VQIQPVDPDGTYDAEITGVSINGDRHQATDHNGRHDQAIAALLGAARQLLDRKHDPAQRGVECRRNAGRPASNQQPVVGHDTTLGVSCNGSDWQRGQTTV